MEDLQPISAAEQVYFCVELMKRLNIQRTQDYLCDITLVTKDDKELKAHKNVLSAASPFFCKLLQSDMKENREGIVRFEEISGSVMEDVLEFIYTGTVKVTQENVKELIAAGNYLLIPSLKTFSGRFVEQQMSISNCISTFYLAEKYDCEELITNSRSFIHENFSSVAGMDEFLNLEAKEVERWISSDDISVDLEADVFKIILMWIKQDKSERKAMLEELFRHVRLGLLSRDFLMDVVTNELVQESFACLRLTSDAIKMTTLLSSDNESFQKPRKGLETRAIVACGGYRTVCYLPEKDQWKRLADVLSSKDHRTQIINFRDHLYAFSGSSNAERFDPVFNSWSMLDLSANSAMVAVVRGEIYAIEVNTSKKETDVKKFSVEPCKWETVLSSHESCRKEACLVVAGNHLYVFGGKPPQLSEYVAKSERFDTVKNKWEKITDMQEERGSAFGVATQEQIFVAGGWHREGNSLMQTCEVYKISTNEWQLIGSLNKPRKSGSMLCLNRKLYVLGGTVDNNRSEFMVECYDPTEGKWINKTTIPTRGIGGGSNNVFTGSVLKLSKGVLDKVKIVGE